MIYSLDEVLMASAASSRRASSGARARALDRDGQRPGPSTSLTAPFQSPKAASSAPRTRAAGPPRVPRQPAAPAWPAARRDVTRDRADPGPHERRLRNFLAQLKKPPLEDLEVFDVEALRKKRDAADTRLCFWLANRLPALAPRLEHAGGGDGWLPVRRPRHACCALRAACQSGHEPLW